MNVETGKQDILARSAGSIRCPAGRLQEHLHLRLPDPHRRRLQRGEAGTGGNVRPRSLPQPDSIINLLRSAAPILTLSGAFTLLMISGYIDLSVGSAMSLSAVVSRG